MEVQAEISHQEKPKKRTVRELLKQYRALALPNAKRFRKRSKLAAAAHRHRVDQAMVRALIHKLTAYMAACEAIKKEENWAINTDYVLGPGNEQQEVQSVQWVGESDPLEIIRKAEKEAA